MTPTTEYEELIDDIVGSHLKCAKGNGTLDDAPIETGPDGFRVTIFAPTAQHGRIKWVDHRPVDKVLCKYSDGFPVWEEMPDGWNAYTCFQGSAPNGELLTFTSALGARKDAQERDSAISFPRQAGVPDLHLKHETEGRRSQQYRSCLQDYGLGQRQHLRRLFP
jgi:hypothetical protein